MEALMLLLTDGTAKAAVMILGSRRVDLGKVDSDTFAVAIKTTLKANIEEIMAEWKAGVEARVGEAWLREMLNLQCNEQALKALALLEQTCPTA